MEEGNSIRVFTKEEKGIGSALYGFTKDITLISYVPQKNKAVVLVSSSHHHKSEDPESAKPHIILDYKYYNCTKGGVDAIDEKCSKFSCSRRSRRWPMTIFYRVFDVSTVNSYILYNSYPENPQIERSDFIKELALQLVTPHLQRRSSNTFISRKLRFSIFRDIE
ncbi:hypothetical protein NQ314_019026 [Rhamnusium bicolor]|uniref:PiggyBac transposable element-derived protein domain-containing protein n=1 Tax=Rhamnusium bicolor TaxID=1586634 RepID=A0AAV8WQL0_9CUCU|nr:hypothetical protein NQ314_019026 [Rhamnusium bicolor]